LSTNATAAHSTCTFNGTPSAGQTITIHNGLNANSLVLTAATSGSNACASATAGTFVTSATTSTEAANLRDAINNCNTSFPAVGFTATSSTNTTTVTAVNPGSGFTFAESAGGFSWGSTVNGTNGSNTCPSSTTGTFATSSSTTTLAANLAAAINACPVAAGVTAASSTNTVTATSRTPGSFTTFSVGAANNTGIFSWGVANAGTDGANACSTSTTGTFATSSSTSTLASNVATAIGLCSAAAGVSASPTANTVAVTATTPGSITFTVADSLSNFAWGAVSGGSDGSNTCPTSTGGTFASNSSTTTLATNLRTAIGLCPAAAGVTATSSTNTVTVTSTTLGSSGTLSVGASNNTGIFSWGAVTAGSNGTNTCPTNTTGTFAVDSTTSGLASNLAAAINACPTPATVGVTAGASGSMVTLTAATLGTGGNSITLADTSSAFAWTAGTLAGGTDGSNTGTNFQFSSGSAPLSTTAVATNLAAAIQRNGATVGVGSTSSANVVTVTAATLGTAGNTIGLSEDISSGFAWSGSGTLAGGLSGSDIGTNFSISSNTTTEATNLALAINRNGATPGGSATSTANVVTITATATGPSGNSITLAEGLGNFTWGGATLAGGAAGQATLVAFNNLYS